MSNGFNPNAPYIGSYVNPATGAVVQASGPGLAGLAGRDIGTAAATGATGLAGLFQASLPGLLFSLLDPFGRKEGSLKGKPVVELTPEEMEYFIDVSSMMRTGDIEVK